MIRLFSLSENSVKIGFVVFFHHTVIKSSCIFLDHHRRLSFLSFFIYSYFWWCDVFFAMSRGRWGAELHESILQRLLQGLVCQKIRHIRKTQGMNERYIFNPLSVHFHLHSHFTLLYYRLPIRIRIRFFHLFSVFNFAFFSILFDTGAGSIGQRQCIAFSMSPCIFCCCGCCSHHHFLWHLTWMGIKRFGFRTLTIYILWVRSFVLFCLFYSVACLPIILFSDQLWISFWIWTSNRFRGCSMRFRLLHASKRINARKEM